MRELIGDLVAKLRNKILILVEQKFGKWDLIFKDHFDSFAAVLEC